MPNVSRPSRSKRPMTFAESLQHVMSSGQKKLIKSILQVGERLQLRHAKALSAIHDSPRSSFPSIAQAIYRYNDYNQLRRMAAWHGHLTQTPSLVVFRVHDQGRDGIYKFRHLGSGDEIRKLLDESGIDKRILIPVSNGFDVLIFDPGRRQRQLVNRHARRTGVTIEESIGDGEIIGDLPDGPSANAKGRDSYRKIIVATEGSHAATH